MKDGIVKPSGIMEKLENSIKDMMLMEQGKKPKKTWNEFTQGFKKCNKEGLQK